MSSSPILSRSQLSAWCQELGTTIEQDYEEEQYGILVMWTAPDGSLRVYPCTTLDDCYHFLRGFEVAKGYGV